MAAKAVRLSHCASVRATAWIPRMIVALVAALAIMVLTLVAPSAALAEGPPTVTGIAPGSGPTAGGTSVVITGTEFDLSSSTVAFGDVPATGVTVDSATQITAIAPAHVAGTVSILVTTSVGTSADTTADDFTYVAPPILTRYDHTDSRISYSGTWATFWRAAAYKGNYKRASSSGASATITFDGERLDWIAMKGTTTGKADVWLDGTYITTVNLANPVAIYQQNVWTTGHLPKGIHTVKIVRSGGNITGKYITVDAVDVDGILMPSSRVEQSDSRLGYKGTWTLASGSMYSGGTQRQANAASASVTITFSGRYLAWIGSKGPGLGIAEITVDDAETTTVDLYNPTAVYRQKVWSRTLPAGVHTVSVKYTGTSNPAATGATIAADAFDVVGTLLQALVWNRYEQTDSRIQYLGTWSTESGTSASGGSDKRAGTETESVSVTFNGQRLDWVATLGPAMGKADISVDGGTAVTVDLFSADTLYQQAIWSTGALSVGTHKVKISWSKENAPGAYINVDAFDVLGALPGSPAITSAEVEWAERRLAELSYRPGPIDGVFDYRTRGAIIAFQKWEGMTRSGVLSAAVLSRLQTAGRPRPSRTGATNPWIEINKAKQVLLYCKNGQVVWTLPVSTGSASVGIVTPSGYYRVQRKTLETSPRYKPLYITSRLLAIHGYPNVPTYPASHGCVRTQKWDQDALYPLIPVGTWVYIH